VKYWIDKIASFWIRCYYLSSKGEMSNLASQPGLTQTFLNFSFSGEAASYPRKAAQFFGGLGTKTSKTTKYDSHDFFRCCWMCGFFFLFLFL